MENLETPPQQPSRLVKKQGVRDVWFWVLLFLLLVFGVEVWLLFRTLFAATMVTSSSMEPLLKPGDALLVRRIRYTPDNPPQRGDVIFFRDPITKRDWLVKRVIGLPGETVTLWMGQVYINGVPLDEPYVSGFWEDYGAWEIPPDGVFVLGDNRAHSNDSRDFGPVPLELIEGKVVFRYFPLERMGRIP
ncbi:MAG: signal peptidase I [Candidatus Fervidibacterota bacterium]